jgi:hypothetical protein
MRKPARICSVCLLVCFAVGAMGQNKTIVGTWKLDVSQSDFGRDPAVQSFTFTMMKDSPKLGSYHGHGVDQDGKRISYLWSGPEDGSMHPLKDEAGKTLGMQSMNKQPNGTILRRGDDSSDGSSFNAVGTISEDGITLVEEVTGKSKDGTETKLRYVYHRVATAASRDKAKSQ